MVLDGAICLALKKALTSTLGHSRRVVTAPWGQSLKAAARSTDDHRHDAIELAELIGPM